MVNEAEVRAFRNYLENYIDITFLVDSIYSTGILSSEDEITFIEELHKQGVEGIIFFFLLIWNRYFRFVKNMGRTMSGVQEPSADFDSFKAFTEKL